MAVAKERAPARQNSSRGSLQFVFFACLSALRTSPPGHRIILFFPLLQPPSSSYFFAVTSFCTPAVGWCALALGRGEPPHRSFPSLNFHRARVRRKPGGHVQTAESDARRAPCLPSRIRENAPPIQH